MLSVKIQKSNNSHYKTLETRFPTLGCVGIFFKTLEYGLFEALPASFPEGCGRLYTPPADVGRSFDVRITRLSVRRFIELGTWFTLASFPEGCGRMYTPPAGRLLSAESLLLCQTGTGVRACASFPMRSTRFCLAFSVCWTRISKGVFLSSLEQSVPSSTATQSWIISKHSATVLTPR